MKKYLTIVFTMLLIFACAIALVACEFHKHNWSSSWDYDDTNHWYSCDGCTEQKDKAAHTFASGKCSVCGKDEVTTNTDIVYEVSEDGSYAICSGLKEDSTSTEIVISSTYKGLAVSKIGNDFCSGNTTIKKVVIPDSVKSAGYYTFKDCTSLTDVELGRGLIYLSYGMFMGCTSLENINIPSNVELIYDYSFRDCTSLTNVNIAEGTEEISEQAFANTTALKSLKLPNSLVTIGEAAFMNSGLQNIVIPDNVTELGPENRTYPVFYQCKSLEDVTIGKGIKTIQEGTFASLPKLKRVTLSEGLETIGSVAFNSCSQLVTINFPESLKVIGERAFYDTGLMEFKSPKNIEHIDADAFSNCKNLKKITLSASSKPVVLGDINGRSPFINDSGWPSSTDIGVVEIVIEEGFKCSTENDIYGLFKGCKYLAKVTLASDFCPTDSMFRNCAQLTEIHFNGTKANWLLHTKDDNKWYDIENDKSINASWWNDGTGAYTVYCLNGETAAKGEK